MDQCCSDSLKAWHVIFQYHVKPKLGPTATKGDKSRQESGTGTDRASRAGVDGYGWCGSVDGGRKCGCWSSLLQFPSHSSGGEGFLFSPAGRQAGRMNEWCCAVGSLARADVQGTAGRVKLLQDRTAATPPCLQQQPDVWCASLVTAAATVQHCCH